MTSTHSIDEYLDVVDKQDKVIGKKKRSEIYAENIFNYRVVNAFVMNSEGKIWIPRRSADKKYFPLSLDVSIGGHVESGESYEEAFKREANEELNIDINQFPNCLLGYLRPHIHNVSSFMNVYEIKMNEIPNFNKDDFIEYFILTPRELFDKITKGDRAKSDLLKLVQMFYL